MPAPNLFCRSSAEILTDEACLLGQESYKCAPDEDDLTCEDCGALVRTVYTLPPHSEQVCASCFAQHEGPQRVREAYAEDSYYDDLLDDEWED